MLNNLSVAKIIFKECHSFLLPQSRIFFHSNSFISFVFLGKKPFPSLFKMKDISNALFSIQMWLNGDKRINKYSLNFNQSVQMAN